MLFTKKGLGVSVFASFALPSGVPPPFHSTLVLADSTLCLRFFTKGSEESFYCVAVGVTPAPGAKLQASPSGGAVVALLTGGALIVYQLGERRILRAPVNEPVISLASVEGPIFCGEDSICVIGIRLELRKLQWSYTRNWVSNSFFYKPDEDIMRTPNLASKSAASLHFGGGYAVFPRRDDDDASVKTQLALYVSCKLYQQEYTLVLVLDDPKGNVAEATGLILRNGGRFVDASCSWTPARSCSAP